VGPATLPHLHQAGLITPRRPRPTGTAQDLLRTLLLHRQS
jgi:hypothetical protein